MILCCNSMKEYEEKAVAFALNPARLLALRNKLKAVRLTCPLFDTARWVKTLSPPFTCKKSQYSDYMLLGSLTFKCAAGAQPGEGILQNVEFILLW